MSASATSDDSVPPSRSIAASGNVLVVAPAREPVISPVTSPVKSPVIPPDTVKFPRVPTLVKLELTTPEPRVVALRTDVSAML